MLKPHSVDPATTRIIATTMERRTARRGSGRGSSARANSPAVIPTAMPIGIPTASSDGHMLLGHGIGNIACTHSDSP